jgi:hypothetical protein
MRIRVKGSRWVRCPIRNGWQYVEDCEQCPLFISERLGPTWEKVVVCAL